MKYRIVCRDLKAKNTLNKAAFKERKLGLN